AAYDANNVIGIALDLDAGTLTFYKDNVTQGQAYSGLTGSWFFAVADASGGVTSLVAEANFGQRPFKFAPPSGFKSLCSTNMPYCIPNPKPDGNAANNATFNSITANQFVYTGYAPTSGTVNGAAIVWGTNADKLANGFKAKTAGNYVITNSAKRLKIGRAQGNP
ncbi:MAG: hypothetical protein ACKO96_45695, partial [Flammeovirgaceae bacterium]